MKRITLLVALIIISIGIFAQRRFDHRGIYGREITVFSASLTAGANYYSGDVEEGGMFSSGFKNQVNYFAKAALGYSPAKYINLKIAITGGVLSGKSNIYEFSSFFVEPDLYIEAHPLTIFSKNDLYFFTGIGINMSKIESYDLADYHINTSALVPVVPVGFGYHYNFESGIHLGFELAIRMALMDRVDKNLDAYPYSINGEMMRGKQSKFLDGYYTFGVKFGYTWF